MGSTEIRQARGTRFAAAALFVLVGGGGAAAAEGDYFGRFEGKFRGSGEIQRDVDASPRSVTCTVASSRPDENRVSISGTCRAAIIFTRRIGAELAFDPATKRYSGVYTGSTKGPATLSGRRRGDDLVLTITYAKPVYGDRTATMIISNAGSASFSMVVTDKVEGRSKQTSNIRFTRS